MDGAAREGGGNKCPNLPYCFSLSVVVPSLELLLRRGVPVPYFHLNLDRSPAPDGGQGRKGESTACDPCWHDRGREKIESEAWTF